MAWPIDLSTWLALLKITGVNIVLSGDNAVVIALACRSLPQHQQNKAIFFGSAGAIVLRVILTALAAYLLQLPYLKIVGSLLLLWIAVRLLMDDGGEDSVEGHANAFSAIKTIIAADLVMSLDNVLGVAAAANGNFTFLAIGLLISLPLIIYGSTLILRLMGRFPGIITLGGALLGFVAGEMSVSDPRVAGLIDATRIPSLHNIAPFACAVLVVILGKLLTPKPSPTVADMAEDDAQRP
jgi:YjbE family integral membrane protein